ncbi:hypothetical protein CC117_31950 [Parafrankia colletiae]|uniref:Uncharacterized protein n=1 Tax=Parafrankia colletiae TaxID=573497 RepID=A0A1S1RGP8_9ACTN|nr:hypothetical protein CC117_31950 [Parafrankia colletiae]
MVSIPGSPTSRYDPAVAGIHTPRRLPTRTIAPAGKSDLARAWREPNLNLQVIPDRALRVTVFRLSGPCANPFLQVRGLIALLGAPNQH